MCPHDLAGVECDGHGCERLDGSAPVRGKLVDGRHLVYERPDCHADELPWLMYHADRLGLAFDVVWCGGWWIVATFSRRAIEPAEGD